MLISWWSRLKLSVLSRFDEASTLCCALCHTILWRLLKGMLPVLLPLYSRENVTPSAERASLLISRSSYICWRSVCKVSIQTLYITYAVNAIGLLGCDSTCQRQLLSNQINCFIEKLDILKFSLTETGHSLHVVFQNRNVNWLQLSVQEQRDWAICRAKIASDE